MDLGINLNGILGKIGRPLPSFFEEWQSLDPLIWDVTDPAGTAWALHVVGGSGWGRFVKTILNASDHAKIITKRQFPGASDNSYFNKKVTIECLLNLGNLANVLKLDGAQSGWGLLDAASGSNCNFTVDVNGNLVIQSGAHSVTVGNSFLAGGAWGTLNRFKVESSDLHSKFWVNGKLTVDVKQPYAGALPAEAAPFFDFYTLPAGGATVYVGVNRLWCDDNP